jgi:hypothetical protein
MTASRTCEATTGRVPSSGRSIAFVVALFALTLNAFLPLAHAVSMRAAWSGESASDGAAARSLWPVLCQAMEGTDDGMPAPPAGKAHECCLGLPNGGALVEPAGIATRIEEVPSERSRPVAPPSFLSSGIRGDPRQSRAPPSFA